MANGRSIAIIQSNYIPWKGYFDIIASVDEFVILDDAQFTRRDWRNRNLIVFNGKLHWLTIPVSTKSRYKAPVNSIQVPDRQWASRHWRTLQHAYRSAPYFATYAARLGQVYRIAADLHLLTQINELFLRHLCDLLEIDTRIVRAEDTPRVASTATERLVEICRARGATEYVSGPSARDYIDHDLFAAADITLRYFDYSRYPPYAQRMEPFEHGVSVLDLLLCEGPAARNYFTQPAPNRARLGKERDRLDRPFSSP